MSLDPHADAYADLLKVPADGWALWNPDHEGVVGDCGILAYGGFFKLFNVFRPPDGLPAISPPNPSEFKSNNRSNQGLSWRAAQSIDWSVDLEIPIGISLSPTEVGFGFKASRFNGAASFLMPGGTTRRVETYVVKRRFEKYLLRNYNTIRAMYPDYGLQTIVILQGTTRTSSWCRGLCRSAGHAFAGFVSVDVAPLLPTFRVGLGRTETVYHPWNVESGPVPQGGSADQTPGSEIPNTCIIVQPVAMRLRDKIRASLVSPFGKSTVVSFSAAPGEQGTSKATGGGATSETQGAAPSSTTSSGVPSRGHSDNQDNNPGCVSAAHASTQCDSSDTSSQLKESGYSTRPSSPEDTPGTQNAIEAMLDAYLDVNPDIDAVVVSWDVLHAKWSSPERKSRFNFTRIQTDGDECFGILDITGGAVSKETREGLIEQRRADNKLAEERSIAQQREKELTLALYDVKLLLQASQNDLVEERRRSEEKDAEAANQLAEERNAALHREAALNDALYQSNRRLYVAKKGEAEMQRRHEQKAAEVVNQLAEERHAARQREEALRAALSESNIRLQEAKEEALEAQRRSEEAAEVTKQLVEECDNARQLEESLRTALFESNRRLEAAQESEVEERRRNERKDTDAAKARAQEGHNARRREEALRTALLDAESRLASSAIDKAMKCRFGEIETVSDQAVVTLFGDVITAVSQLASFVAGQLNDKERTSSLVYNNVRGVAASDDLTGNMMFSFLLPMARAKAKVELVALPVMQFIAFAVLSKRVFLPTSLTSPNAPEVSQHLQRLQDLVAAREPQERYGGWRSITYSALRVPGNDAALARDIAMEIRSSIAPILLAMLPPSIAHNDVLNQRLFDGFEERAVQAVLDAMKLQDMMQQFYISQDYALFLPAVGHPFSENNMEPFVDEGIKNKLATTVRHSSGSHGTVLLPVTPGLCAACTKPNLSRLEIAVKKASVVALH